MDSLDYITKYMEFINGNDTIIVIIASIAGLLIKKNRYWIIYCLIVGGFFLSPFVLSSAFGWISDGFSSGNLGNYLYFILIGLVVTGVRFFYVILLGGVLRLVKFFITWAIRKVRKTAP